MPCSWIGRIHIIKMSIPSKVIYWFNALLIKIPMVYFRGLEQIFQKFIWNHKRHWIATSILRNKNKIRGIMQPDIKQYWKAIEIKIAWHWHKKRHRTMQQNRSPEINPHFYSWLIFDKGGNNIQWVKDSVWIC